MDEITFYYVVYINDSNPGFSIFWKNFIISLTILRETYPNNKVVVITYENATPPRLIYDLASVLNYKLVQEEPVYNHYDHQQFNYMMFSRQINCYNHGKHNKAKIIYLDVDVFVMKKFDNLNWDKFGVLGSNHGSINGGVFYFDTTKPSTEYYVEFIKKEIQYLIENHKKSKTDYIRNVYPHCNDNCSVQEETMLRNFCKRDSKEYFKHIYNIGSQNNGVAGEHKLHDDNHMKQINNIHLVVVAPKRIPSLIYKSKYFNHMLRGKDHIRKLLPELANDEFKKLIIKMI